MIDEADEFVTGPQNKKRGNSGDPNSGTAPKRRRSMSPLLRRPQTPPIITNHVVGKGAAGGPGQQGLIKPIPLLKGNWSTVSVTHLTAQRGLVKRYHHSSYCSKGIGPVHLSLTMSLTWLKRDWPSALSLTLLKDGEEGKPLAPLLHHLVQHRKGLSSKWEGNSPEHLTCGR